MPHTTLLFRRQRAKSDTGNLINKGQAAQLHIARRREAARMSRRYRLLPLSLTREQGSMPSARQREREQKFPFHAQRWSFVRDICGGGQRGEDREAEADDGRGRRSKDLVPI